MKVYNNYLNWSLASGVFPALAWVFFYENLSLTGEYVWQFNKAKTHHIWSGYVDATDTVNFRGTITAVDRVDTAAEVEVTVDGHPAIHIVTGETIIMI